MMTNAPPPLLPAMYGKRQMLPKPMALPAAASTAPSRPPNEALLSAVIDVICKNVVEHHFRGAATTFELLCERHADTANLTSQRGCQLRDRTLHAFYLCKTRVQSFDDIHCHAFYGALRAAHLLVNGLVDRQVVY